MSVSKLNKHINLKAKLIELQDKFTNALSTIVSIFNLIDVLLE